MDAPLDAADGAPTWGAALPLITYGLALVLQGNGFVAAFVAGVVFAAASRDLPEYALNLAEDIGMLLSLVVWFIFGGCHQPGRCHGKHFGGESSVMRSSS